jgi:hypothetical protein
MERSISVGSVPLAGVIMRNLVDTTEWVQMRMMIVGSLIRGPSPQLKLIGTKLDASSSLCDFFNLALVCDAKNAWSSDGSDVSVPLCQCYTK